ncbi:hypothetical protein [Leifsonia shinshuensis]|uniref:Uncharacterized protein n=1 Tax=Leifsonia shinshuensis TaxID=150026 RepID=A0A7G6YEE2_9MICO|nr:hypothetical protein [Leifsonia shinshuensis]QNE36857.1 hypothetical protein F1C12_18210 [Leifsonia shinshuensis]
MQSEVSRRRPSQAKDHARHQVNQTDDKEPGDGGVLLHTPKIPVVPQRSGMLPSIARGSPTAMLV